MLNTITAEMVPKVRMSTAKPSTMRPERVASKGMRMAAQRTTLAVSTCRVSQNHRARG